MGDNTATAGVEHMIGLSPLWVSFYSCNQGGAVTRGIFVICICTVDTYLSEFLHWIHEELCLDQMQLVRCCLALIRGSPRKKFILINPYSHSST